MMKKMMLAVFIAAICTACGGGSPVDRSIKQVEQALERVEKNKADMTRADWEALGAEMEEPLTVINEALESDRIGVVGKVKVVMLVAKITTVMAEAGVSALEAETGIDREDFGTELEKLGGEIEQALEQAEETVTEGSE
jgi:hypothetical protein